LTGELGIFQRKTKEEETERGSVWKKVDVCGQAKHDGSGTGNLIDGKNFRLGVASWNKAKSRQARKT